MDSHLFRVFVHLWLDQSPPRYIYIYVCMYVYISMYIYTHIYIYMYIHVYTYMCVYSFMYINVYKYMNKYINIYIKSPFPRIRPSLV